MDNVRLQNKDEWYALEKWLPDGWQQKLRDTGMFVRSRKIKTPSDMVRLILAYPVLKMSLPQVTEWAEREGIASMAFVSLWERYQKSVPFLKWLVQSLIEIQNPFPQFGARFVIIDGTIFPLHGTGKTNWLVHLLWGDGSPIEVHVTKNKGVGNGETVKRFQKIPAGAVITGDRAYGTPPQIVYAVQQGYKVLFRFTWNNLPLYSDREGTKYYEPQQMLKGMHPGENREFTAWVRTSKGETVQGRCVVICKNPESAEQGLRKSIKESVRKGHKPRETTCFLAQYTTIFTTLTEEEADTTTVLEAYRWRWQIEREFHRLKSITRIRTMDNSKDSMVEFYLLALLAAWLLSQRIAQNKVFFPWGYPLMGCGTAGNC